MELMTRAVAVTKMAARILSRSSESLYAADGYKFAERMLKERRWPDPQDWNKGYCQLMRYGRKLVNQKNNQHTLEFQRLGSTASLRSSEVGQA